MATGEENLIWQHNCGPLVATNRYLSVSGNYKEARRNIPASRIIELEYRPWARHATKTATDAKRMASCPAQPQCFASILGGMRHYSLAAGNPRLESGRGQLMDCPEFCC